MAFQQCTRKGIIRKAVSDDILSIQKMVIRAYSKYIPRIGKPPAPMQADYTALLQTHDVFVLVEEETGSDNAKNTNETGKEDREQGPKVVGSVVLGMTEGSDAIKINNLVVDPDAQGRGYGRLLMAKAETEARDKGCVALELFTNILMHENMALYPKLGFEELGRHEQDGFQRAFFRKRLPAIEAPA